MALISLKNVAVNFPIYGAGANSFKKTLAASVTGGRFGKETGVAVVQALSDINIELKSGDRLGLVGHNGAGKSTLLRTLAGIYEPSAGVFVREGCVASLIDPLHRPRCRATGRSGWPHCLRAQKCRPMAHRCRPACAAASTCRRRYAPPAPAGRRF